MKIIYEDFNEHIESTFWQILANILAKMPLHLKYSDQSGLQGKLIFDPVGTNQYLKTELSQVGFLPNAPIPEEFSFLGKDVDFAQEGLLLEAQFSNYPFLLNNLLRAELFYRGHIPFDRVACQALIIITKGYIFPASNSTLYYEQAINQLRALSRYQLFSIPIRVIGLIADPNSVIPSIISTYSQARYSRQVVQSSPQNVRVVSGKSARCFLEINP